MIFCVAYADIVSFFMMLIVVSCSSDKTMFLGEINPSK